MNKVVLFQDKSQCCGCCACANACPKKAISMVEDSQGFIYPQIDYDKCVSCRMCEKVCAYKDPAAEKKKDRITKVAVAKDKILLGKSASGGVFASFAENVIKKNGSVYGCAFITKDGKLLPRHIRITDKSDIYKIQGSKYVQSFVGEETLKNVKKI